MKYRMRCIEIALISMNQSVKPSSLFVQALFCGRRFIGIYHASHICAPIEIKRLKSSSRNAIAVMCFGSPALSTMRIPSAISRDVAHPTTSLVFQPRPPIFWISYGYCISLCLCFSIVCQRAYHDISYRYGEHRIYILFLSCPT